MIKHIINQIESYLSCFEKKFSKYQIMSYLRVHSYSEITLKQLYNDLPKMVGLNSFKEWICYDEKMVPGEKPPYGPGGPGYYNEKPPGGSNIPIRGCTDPNAKNYNKKATIENGSCDYSSSSESSESSESSKSKKKKKKKNKTFNNKIFNNKTFTKSNISNGLIVGCTDPYALNYNPIASIDNDNCKYSSSSSSSSEKKSKRSKKSKGSKRSKKSKGSKRSKRSKKSKGSKRSKKSKGSKRSKKSKGSKRSKKSKGSKRSKRSKKSKR